MGRRGLGRGLSALITTGESVGGLQFEELPVAAIRANPNQPRRSFPEEGIKELAASIRESGILQPLVVRPAAIGFELIAGERRLRAAKEAGLERVPVLIRQAEDNESMQLALVENLQREELNPLETAQAYEALIDGFNLSQEQLAAKVGKSRAAVTNTLRLMQLPEPVKVLLLSGDLTEGHARAILSLKDEEQMIDLANKAQAQKLTVRKTEELARNYGKQDLQSEKIQTEKKTNDQDGELRAAEQRVQEAIKLPVKVKASKRGGRIEIRFRDKLELETVVDLLTSREREEEI